ncbi:MULTISPECIES: hypothetical protein [Micromonospora]|uniref:Uncharacterized protein n=1 Tax=Micromonospora citrea TaxID=47855 RepID=A0A1C6VWB8_9ACTN|nr:MULTISPECIES: hypothetical protein [Micromonospora]SCL70595.1 hypothetical protein GA0070606_5448 [Micromonospora citrea]
MVSMAMIQAARAAQFPSDPYAWVLTRDRDHELHGTSESEVGTAGPGQATEEMFERARTQGRRFRLLDEGDIDEGAIADGKDVDPDERGVVYEGLIWTEGEPGGEADFGPLYDFGTPNYGCVEIQYREGDRWVSL